MISILKANYEKATLFFCLSISTCCLFWLMTIILETLPELPPLKNPTPYYPINPNLYPNTPPFAQKWLITPGYKEKEKFHKRTDLLKAIEAARCPHCSHLIPLADYNTKICSYCQKKLPEPIIPDKQNIDSDLDGIPDHIELKFNLNPNNPEDANTDQDQDGFSNKYEYSTSKTALDDAKSRPALINHLKLTKISRQKLPIRFTKVTTHKSQDKATWFIFGKLGKQSKVRIWQLGDLIRVGKKQYKITNIIFKTKQQYNPTYKIMNNVDISTIEFIQHPPTATSDPIIAPVNETIYLPERFATLKDSFTKRTVKGLSKGESIILGNTNTGFEKYIIAQVDGKNKKVKLEKLDVENKPTEHFEIKLK